MQELELSQATLAERLGVQQSNVSTYLTGKRDPGLEIVERWAEALECTAADLMSEKPAAAPGLEGERLNLIGLILRADATNLKTMIRVLSPYLSGEQKKSATGNG